jgi:surface protein
MFYSCERFNSNLSKWDVSKGTYFVSMLGNCLRFNSDLSKWVVSNGEDFSGMFLNTESFNSDLSKWNVKNAKKWDRFAKGSLLEKYPERIPDKFRSDYI